MTDMPQATPGQLATALDIAGRLIAAIGPDQWDLPTPCEKWRLRDLVNHMAAGNTGLARALGTSAPPLDTEDPAAAFAGSARLVLDVFSQPVAPDRLVSVPLGMVPAGIALHLRITDTLAHGWDVARATGQKACFPDELAEQEIGWARGALAQLPPDNRAFAPAKPITADASAIDRLAALLGREP